MDYVRAIKDELEQYADKAKAEFLPRFLRAFPGGYGAGDTFLGVPVPGQRKVARKFYKQVPLNAVTMLLHEPIHEYRLTALLILVYKYEKPESQVEKKAIVDLYLDNTSYINNWDLVDSSAEKILGPYLLDKDKKVL